MATRSARKAPILAAPDESTLTPDSAPMSDPNAYPDPAPMAEETAPAPALSQKELDAIEKRKAYSKARRERIKAEQEAAGLILKREYRTADGAVFTNKKDAARHIATLAFTEYVQANPFAPEIDGAAVNVPAPVLAAWIEAHREYLLPYLRSVNV